MSKCPVCNSPIIGILCEECGFDRSMDYENYPTLAPLPQNLPSVSSRIRQHGAASASLFSCPGCGGKQFSISIPLRACVCTGCGEAVGLDRPLEEADAWKSQMENLTHLIRSRHSVMDRQLRNVLAALSKLQTHR